MYTIPNPYTHIDILVKDLHPSDPIFSSDPIFLIYKLKNFKLRKVDSKYSMTLISLCGGTGQILWKKGSWNILN